MRPLARLYTLERRRVTPLKPPPPLCLRSASRPASTGRRWTTRRTSGPPTPSLGPPRCRPRLPRPSRTTTASPRPSLARRLRLPPRSARCPRRSPPSSRRKAGSRGRRLTRRRRRLTRRPPVRPRRRRSRRGGRNWRRGGGSRERGRRRRRRRFKAATLVSLEGSNGRTLSCSVAMRDSPCFQVVLQLSVCRASDRAECL